MRRLFLLRAYGDFVIAIRAILNSPQPSDTKIIASNHFIPLFEAINEVFDLSPLDIDFQDFGINQSLLNFFTDKQLFTFQTIRQIVKIKRYLKSNADKKYSDYLEQEKRLSVFNFLVNHKFKGIVKKENIYKTYETFFNSIHHELKFEKIKIKNVLILPDARTKIKTVPDFIIKDISDQFKGASINVNIAKFDNKISSSQSLLIYNNFEQLIELINKHDLVIGADSLPIHLCNLFNKPHYILYPHNQPNAFCTLFSLQNNFFTNFNKYSRESFAILN